MPDIAGLVHHWGCTMTDVVELALRIAPGTGYPASQCQAISKWQNRPSHMMFLPSILGLKISFQGSYGLVWTE